MKSIVCLCLMFGTWLAAPDFSPAQTRLGFVDFQYVVSQVKSSADIQIELQKLAAQWTDQITAMRDSVSALEKEMETISITLTKTGRDVIEKRIKDGKQQINAFQEQKFSPVNGELYKKQQELLQPLVDKIRKGIDNVRIREKYDVIFDISAGNPVSIDKKYDVTPLVLQELTGLGLSVLQQTSQAGTELPSSNRRPTGATTVTPKKPVDQSGLENKKDESEVKKIDE